LVGAVARDVWMSAINNIDPRRTTGDIDFAVMINDKESYGALKQYLIQNEWFHPLALVRIKKMMEGVSEA
jgi:predicted nucleotidyltransferase